MSKLTDFRLLSFDVYGTLIDWENGVLTGLQPLISSAGLAKKEALELYFELEKTQQSNNPDMLYSQLLTAIYPQFAKRLNLPPPDDTESENFGSSVGKWPAFPDSVDALRRLAKYYKLVILSNVDRESFRGSNSGPLQGVHFDKIITAQDVGSYKPSLKNFEFMLKTVKDDFGVDKSEVLQTAQSQFHDHHSAREMGIKSCWIHRYGTMGSREGDVVYDWKFQTLGEMADEVEREARGKES
ncbi:hypothetical protein H2200_005926 [Cladophialophora chaetospira]|uniref:Uncharacterized protein n=1 Tax=Cladophialophora chaetospira TaxID=386627 RepID=A0AA39CI24_9EURO|nr:hypothetical protein H2200_005926 [Cladophialophora chaetospira]